MKDTHMKIVKSNGEIVECEFDWMELNYGELDVGPRPDHWAGDNPSFSLSGDEVLAVIITFEESK